MDKKSEILKLRAQGLGYGTIAKIVGLHKRTVEYHCNPQRYNKLQMNRRRNIKLRLIQYKGGKCEKCGYNKSKSALDFHHRNPLDKKFGIAKGVSLAYGLPLLLEEIQKCILLCSNCHHELHDGLINSS